jgi:PKD repeat protein
MKRFVGSFAILLIISFGAALSYSARAQSSGEPESPRVYLSTGYPVTSGAILNVGAGGNLQAALDSAQSGDTIVLQAGAVFSGNFILRAKSGNDWIIIRTSNLGGISTEGTRVTPGQAGAMPRIVTSNAAPAIATAAGAHHYRLVGLEIGIAAGVATNYGIITFGDGSQSSLSLVPHDLVIDRCYIHGNPTGDVSRGVALNSASTAIIDSNISSCHGVGFDTQGIAGWNGPGPFKIVNNFLEAAGENLMFGGADPRIPNLVPSDIEFRRNQCSKPLSWNPSSPSYAGIHWSVKNLFELKNAQRVLIDGNLFENCWVDGQTGFIIVLTPRNQEGTAPWSVVQDVTFTNNIGRHAAAGIQFLGLDNNYPSQRAQRIKITNNLFHDIGGAAWGGNGRLFQLVEGTADVHIDHNTAIQTSNIVTADGAPHTGFVFTNNITPHNDYGVIGSGHSIGNDSLSYYFPACLFSKNVIIGGPGQVYPTGNFFPASILDVQFVDPASFNFRLDPGSPYKNAGTDGRDIGADQDAILAAFGDTQGPPSPNQTPLVSIVASATGGAAPLNTDFSAIASDPDGTISSYNWDFGDGQTSSQSSVSHLYQSVGSFNARVTVTDNAGASATASTIIVVSNSLPPGNEVVLYPSRAPLRVGRWNQLTDLTAAGAACLWNPDVGAAKLTSPVANPVDYFEMSFYAVAGTPYRLWMRAKAQNDSPYNDSVFIQFSGSVSNSGASVFRIGTTDATTVNLEDCSGCGIQGWGWQDNGWGVGVMGPLLYFSNTGPQTIRVQVREDGMMIDQIVLSPQYYLNTSPGALTNDNVILPERSGLSVTTIGAVMPSSGSVAGGTAFIISGDGFAAGAIVKIGGIQAVSVQVQSATSITAVTPDHSAGAVDVNVTNIDGRTATLLGGYTYVADNQTPQVNIAASATSGIAPVTVGLTANATDSDGFIASYLWDFGDGQTSTLPVVTHVYQSPGVFNARITVTDNLGATGTAAITISVSAPTLGVSLLSPNGGETLRFDSMCNIQWSVTGGTPVRQDVSLSLDGGSTWTALASGLPGTVNGFSWHVPRTASTTGRIRVRVWNASGVYVDDASDRVFTIQRRSK